MVKLLLSYDFVKLRFSKKYVVLFLFLFGYCNIVTAQQQKPNIILILADDIGYKSLTCDGGTLYNTPNLDSMAKNGMRFTQCQTSPLCCPSRAMLLTGQYNFRNYVGWDVMDTSQQTIGDLFRSGGYTTAFYGKNQINAGTRVMKAFGFDKYAVSTSTGPKYKNPAIFCNNGLIPDSLAEGKYSEDIFTDSLLSFIDANKSRPFFAYYPMVLVHKPFQPTPDDSAFDTWNPNQNDTSYYPSMMHYMDEKVGLILQKVKDAGLESNTLVLFLADNGTSADVKDYVDDDSVIFGGKKQTTEAGTHVPFIAYWPGVVAPGSVNNNLIDLTDFLPTLASICGIKPNKTFRPLDGVNFASQLKGDTGAARNWVYCYFDPHPGKTAPQRWAQTTTYKLYDTSATNGQLLFYNIANDPDENNPIPDSLLTTEEAAIKQQLLDVINGYVAQGFAILDKPRILSVTDSSCTVDNLIETNGSSTITSSGIVWGKTHHPDLLSGSHTSDNNYWGGFTDLIKGLNDNTTYYVRTYATNAAGTAYSDEVSFSTSLKTPVCLAATAITAHSFKANWKPENNADYYKIDLSTVPAFSSSVADSITEGFSGGTTPPEGWLFSHNNIVTNEKDFGNAAPSLSLIHTGAGITTLAIPAVANSLKFWIKSNTINNKSSLLVEGFNGIRWVTIENISNILKTPTIKIYDSTSSPALGNNLTMFRFTFTKAGGEISLDDISVNYVVVHPLFIQGYNGKKVYGDSVRVSGLDSSTTYYYRIKAMSNGNDSSANSNIIKVTTAAADTVEENQILQINIFPNPFYDEFTLKIKTSDTKPVTIILTDVLGHTVYKFSGKNLGNYTVGRNLSAGTYFVHVIQGNVERKSKIIKLNR